MILWGISGGVIKTLDYEVKSRRGEKYFCHAYFCIEKMMYLLYTYMSVSD